MKIILFDSGYLIFNTIYRIEKKYNIDLNNTNFKRLYTNLFYSTIKKLLLKYDILKSNKNRAFFVKDCPRGTIWRKEKDNEYKITVNETYDDNKCKLFYYTYSVLFPICYKEYKIITVSVNNAEADDIIKLMVDKYKKETIYIVTNDRDLYQLLLVKMDLTIVSYSGITKVEKICKFLKDIYENYVNATEKDIYIMQNYGEYSKNILNLKYTPKDIEENYERVMCNIDLLC